MPVERRRETGGGCLDESTVFPVFRQSPRMLWDLVGREYDAGRFVAFPIISYSASDMTPEQIVKDSDGLSRWALDVHRRWNSRIMTHVMDLTVEPATFGAKVLHFGNEPQTQDHPLASVESLSKARMPEDFTGTPMGDRIEAQRKMAGNLLPHVIRGEQMAGPFTAACNLGDMSEIMRTLIGKGSGDDYTKGVIDFATGLSRRYLTALIGAGLQVAVILDPLAGQIAPESFRQYAKEPLKAVISYLHENGRPAILHICGNTTNRLIDMCETGADALSLDAKVDMKEALEVVSEYNRCHRPDSPVLVIGNLSPAILAHNSASEVSEATLKMLEAYQDSPIWVPGTGCQIGFGTPNENIDAFVKTIVEFRRRR